MKKLAIFTEGQTEQLLSEWLVNFIAGGKKIQVTKVSASGGGSRNKPRIIELKMESESVEYFVLIVDSGTDSKVKSDIRDQCAGLINAGYQKVLGIRDVYPEHKYEEISRLRSGFTSELVDKFPQIQISFIFGVMEIEAWFLAEYNHFQKIHGKITVDRIKEEFGIDIINDNLSLRETPAKDLKNIYWLENIEYDKSKQCIDKILSALDIQHLKENISHKFEDLKNFYKELEDFFTNTFASQS
jgi:hypothetical protein